MRDIEYTNWACPSCGRLTSKPWDAVWCSHYDFHPYPPDSGETDWTRMVRVTHVETEPVEEVLWVVAEYQNSIGWKQDEWHDALPGTPEPGDFDWNYRVVSEPMSREEAYAEAERRPRREGWPRHMHDWKAYPLDIAADFC